MIKIYSLFRLPPLPLPIGNLSVNTRLLNSVYIAENKLVGPETLAISKDGDIFTGLMNGDIVRIDKYGNINRITKIGQTTNDSFCSI